MSPERLIETRSLESFHSSRCEVHVWLVPVRVYDAESGTLFGTLSEDEKARAARFMFAKDQRRFVTAHGALRLILAEYTGVDPCELSFAQGENGKPGLCRPASDVFFNLSHSGDYTLIGVTKRLRVGIDIEGTRSNIEYLELSRRLFSPSECAWLDSRPDPEQLTAFFRIWVVKEAFLKATGVGLSDSLNEITVTFGSNGSVGLRYGPDDTPETRWLAKELELVPGYASAVVVEEPAGSPPLKIRFLEPWCQNASEGKRGIKS